MVRFSTCRWLLVILFLLAGLWLGAASNPDFPTDGDEAPYGDSGDSGWPPSGQDSSGQEPVSDETGSLTGEDPEDGGFGEPAPAPVPPVVVPKPPVQLDQKTVTIGRTPYLRLKDMMREVSALFPSLKKAMGVKEVRLVTAPDYAGVLTALARGTIDFAWVGPMTYIIARERGNLIPLAKAFYPGGGAYRGVFIARQGGEVQGLDDVRRRTIGFVDPESASGYLYPLAVLQRLKINPHKVCSKVFFLKKHDAVLRAVLEGRIDVGVCLEGTLAAVTDPKIRNQLLVLGKTELIPSDVLVCREDCPVNLREAFLAALLKRNSAGTTGSPTVVVRAPAGLPLPPAPPAKEPTGSAGASPALPTFLPATDEDFQPVRAVWNTVRPIAHRP